ncbi:MAG: oligosaccharide flippase family protein [Candidatus Omnitrophica bacterium]|nr:oligosaccharide flippase family protein [Candidatus Omnitrophota bacterium]
MRRILKVASILGVATLVKIFAGAIRAKFLACYLGPAGVGVISQALMYSGLTIQFCSLNMGMGITKYISESIAEKREDKIPLIINTAGTFQLAASLLLIAAVLPFSKDLTKFVFSDSRYWIYFVGITLVTPLALYMIGMADPIFYGFRKIAEYTKLMIWYTVATLVILIAAVYFYRVDGVLVQILIVSAIGFGMASYFLKNKIALAPRIRWGLFKDKESRAVSKQLFKYGLISFIPANVNMFVILYLRSLFMKQYSADANGYYQVAYGISAYYLPFVTNGIWGHFYPEMCALKDNKDINRELNQFVRFAVLVSTAIAAGCIIFRKYIILILFSGQFMKAYDLLAIQAIGDIFFILFCMFSTALMARKQFKGVILISTIGYNAVLLLSYLTLTHFSIIGFRSLNLSIAFTNLMLVAVYMIYSKYDTGFVLTGNNIARIMKSVVFLGIIYFIPDVNIGSVIIKIAVGLGWIALTISKDEARRCAEAVSVYFNKKGK